MTGSAYPEYQRAPDAWMGDVPAHWGLERMKYGLTEKTTKKGSDLPPGAISYGKVVAKDAEKITPETRATYQEVLAGEYLINPINLNYDLISLRTALSDINVCVSPAYIVLRAVPEKVHPVFGSYVLHVFDVCHMKTLGAGVRQTITFKDIGQCVWPLPPMEEQAAIVAFLDSETGRIDGLIEKKTRFIALLKEKRAAVITHAVTKGIDPNAPMKEGPFKAVGMVPETWDISPIGRALRLRKNTVGSRHGDYRLLSLTTRGVIERDISENFGKFPESFDTYQEVRPGDFVFCLFDIDETPRTVGLSDLHGMITGAYSVFDCLAPIYSKYLYFLFLHLDMCKGLKPFYTGLRKTIRPPKFTSIRIPFPPEDDARRIVEHIETQTAKIDGLIALTERSIDLLREKRAALITAAVTGKIDVRRAA